MRENSRGSSLLGGALGTRPPKGGRLRGRVGGRRGGAAMGS
ncbi:hypothetical protein ACFCX0_47025 [Streptomyces sp. NPDC056352]